MLLFALLGLILWILLQLWRINTQTEAMPVKGEESPPAVKEDIHAKQSSHLGEHSLSAVHESLKHNEVKENSLQPDCASASPEVKTKQHEVEQGSSEVNSGKPSAGTTTQISPRAAAPMLSSGPEARDRLKFILGASEDNSSDEEPLVTKPPSGTSRPPASNSGSSSQRMSSAELKSSSSGIK